MKLEGYLITEGRTKEISEKKFITDVKKKCSQILGVYKKTNQFYYRGIHENFIGDFGFIQPSKFKRESAWATFNTYTLLLDNLPSWKKYPKRSKSVIMTTDRRNAQSRAGNNIPCIVFPVNGSNIGVCRNDDIWDSFPDLFYEWGISHMDEFNQRMGQLSRWMSNGTLDMNEWKDVKKLLDMKPTDTENDNAISYLEDNYDIEPNKTIGDQLISLLDPKRNDFQLLTTKNNPPMGKKEAWTDGDCYLIDAFIWERKIEDMI